MGTHPTRLDRVLAAGYQSNIADLDLAVIRERRVEANREETDLSFLRRVLHGRIDIIDAEARRRAGQDGPDAVPIVGRLAHILSDAPSRHPRSARHVGVDPGGEPGGYRQRVEGVLSALELSDVLDRSDAGLAAARSALAAVEGEVSEYRVRVQAVVDRFAEELMRRYRVGEATVDDLLDAESASDAPRDAAEPAAREAEHRME